MKRLIRCYTASLVLGISVFFVLALPAKWSLAHPARNVGHNSLSNLENRETVLIASDSASNFSPRDLSEHSILGGWHLLDTQFGRVDMFDNPADKNDGVNNRTLAELTKSVHEGGRANNNSSDGPNLYPTFPSHCISV